MAGDRIKIGGLKGPHGLQGWVKAKLFVAAPEDLLGQALELENGTAYPVQALKTVGQGLVALQLQGINTPEQATALKGPLYLPKAALALDDDEVLLADLLGQPLLGPTGSPCGTITGITELPAGPALQVKTAAEKPKTLLIPVATAFVTLTAATPPTAQLTDLGEQLLQL
jgi:16S rRNA processing protein RimM